MNKSEFKKTALGGLTNNPVFVLVLGMCPTIAQSRDVISALGLGCATAVVLVFSNLAISLLRKVIPDKVRLPAYIVIIATFVTIVQMVMSGFLPDLYASVSKFIPLIVVNCIILGRAESFASKNGVLESVVDGLSMGIGFIASMCLLGAIRQGLGMLGLKIFVQPIGGFMVLGFIMALFNFVMHLYHRRKKTLMEA